VAGLIQAHEAVRQTDSMGCLGSLTIFIGYRDVGQLHTFLGPRVPGCALEQDIAEISSLEMTIYDLIITSKIPASICCKARTEGYSREAWGIIGLSLPNGLYYLTAVNLSHKYYRQSPCHLTYELPDLSLYLYSRRVAQTPARKLKARKYCSPTFHEISLNN
jgi:hypothetical protein